MNRLQDRVLRRLGRVRPGAWFVPGLCFLLAVAVNAATDGPSGAAWASATQSNPYAIIEDELYDGEKESFSEFLGTLTQPEKDSLASFSNRLDHGEHGLFALLLVESSTKAAKDLLALLADLDDQQLGSLAGQLTSRPFEQWQAIPELLQSASIAEVENELFPEAGHEDCWLESGGRIIGSSAFEQGRPAGVTICSDAVIRFRGAYRNRPPRVTPRVTRGVLAQEGEAPWQAQLALHGAITRAYHSAADRASQTAQFGRPLFDWEINHACGAVYIGGRFLLTAAHCIGGLPDAVFFDGRRVRLGTQRIDGDHNLMEIRTVTLHADYNANNHINDIALIELSKTPSFRKLQAATLPTRPKAGLPVGKSLLLTGWGYQGATLNAGNALDIDGQFQSRAAAQLQKGTVLLQQNNACNNNSNFRKKRYRILAGQFCAGSVTGVDSCRGDSGGPLIDAGDGTLVGLVSYGPGCGLKNTPGVYVDVGFYSDWISRAKRGAASAKARKKYLLR